MYNIPLQYKNLVGTCAHSDGKYWSASWREYINNIAKERKEYVVKWTEAWTEGGYTE